METDAYYEHLDDMIELFQEYKSGSVTLENITKLCQTLGLESFIDDVDAETARLSTASKIIVIDIDFSKKQRKVTDVKLVLASNFDSFNYFIDYRTSDSPSNNILLNSLTQYPDLHEFHRNLKFLYLLDNFSNIDIDPTNGSSNNNFGSNVSSGNEHGFAGKLDLFKYYTELATFVGKFLADNSAPFTVSTNRDNSFGIYVLTGDQTVLARIYFEKSKDPQHRLYEFVYTEETKDWININSENYACGISLVMEIQSKEDMFPQDFILQDMIVEGSTFENQDAFGDTETCNLNELISKITSNYKISDRIHLMNDFTTKFIKVKKFNISNDNVEVLFEILNWLQWSQTVLKQLYALIISKDDASKESSSDTYDSNLSAKASCIHTRRRSSTGQKRRRHSNKNRRPSITESAMLKDEGLQQYNLHEIMTDVNPNSQPDAQSIVESTKNTLDSENMDIDATTAVVEEWSQPLQLLINEDHISLGKIARCSLYDDSKNWNIFIDILKNHIC